MVDFVARQEESGQTSKYFRKEELNEMVRGLIRLTNWAWPMFSGRYEAMDVYVMFAFICGLVFVLVFLVLWSVVFCGLDLDVSMIFLHHK